MINKKEFIQLDIENDWINEGLDYALISWTSTFNRMGKPNPYSRIEKILLGIIAEKAVENYLIQNGKEYETSGKTKWYETDRYDVGIKHFAIDVKSNFLNTHSPYLIKKYSNLEGSKLDWFLKCHALVPLDQLNPGKNKRRVHKRDKIYVFPFIEGEFHNDSMSNPMIHAFWDYRWLKRAEHKNLPNLGHLQITYKGKSKDGAIKIFGTTSKNVACTEIVNLNSKELETKNDFFQVFSIVWQAKSMPQGTLTISSKTLNLIEKIKPECSFELEKIDDGYKPKENNWQSLAIANSTVYLLGWAYEEDFRIDGQEFKRFTKSIEQYSEIKVDNWGCLMGDLEPMKNILNI